MIHLHVFFGQLIERNNCFHRCPVQELNTPFFPGRHSPAGLWIISLSRRSVAGLAMVRESDVDGILYAIAEPKVAGQVDTHGPEIAGGAEVFLHLIKLLYASP